MDSRVNWKKMQHKDRLLYGLVRPSIKTSLDPSYSDQTKQDSWAIAKMTARCAQYMGALKSFESPHYAAGYTRKKREK